MVRSGCPLLFILHLHPHSCTALGQQIRAQRSNASVVSCTEYIFKAQNAGYSFFVAINCAHDINHYASSVHAYSNLCVVPCINLLQKRRNIFYFFQYLSLSLQKQDCNMISLRCPVLYVTEVLGRRKYVRRKSLRDSITTICNSVFFHGSSSYR